MAFEDTMGALMQMLTTTEAVAAIGAELSLRSSGTSADPSIEAGLGAVSAAAGLDLGSLEPQQQAMLLGVIRLFFAQAADLLHDPSRAPGWTITDPMVLEGVGRTSMMIPGAPRRLRELANVTSFLDVGVGVGGSPDRGRERVADRVGRGYRRVGSGARTTAPTCTTRGSTTASSCEIRTRRDSPTSTSSTGVSAHVLHPGEGAPDGTSQDRAVVAAGWLDRARHDAVAAGALAEATSTLRTVRSGGAVLDAERATDLSGAPAARRSTSSSAPRPSRSGS